MNLLQQRLSALLQHDFFRLLGGSAYVFVFRIMGAASVYLTLTDSKGGPTGQASGAGDSDDL